MRGDAVSAGRRGRARPLMVLSGTPRSEVLVKLLFLVPPQMKLFVYTNYINTGIWMFCFRRYRSRFAHGGSAVLTKVLVFISTAVFTILHAIGIPRTIVGRAQNLPRARPSQPRWPRPPRPLCCSQPGRRPPRVTSDCHRLQYSSTTLHQVSNHIQ